MELTRFRGVCLAGWQGGERCREDIPYEPADPGDSRTFATTYGAPRVHAELAAQGVGVGRKRVARMMEVASIHGGSRRKWIATTTRDGAADAGILPATGPELPANQASSGTDDRW